MDKFDQVLGSFLSAAPTGQGVTARAENVARRAEAATAELLRRETEVVPRIAEANSYSASEAKRAFHSALDPIRADALMSLWAKDFQPRKTALHGMTVVFGGGSIPQPNLFALIAAMMVSEKVLYRPPADDPFLVPLFVQAMAAPPSEVLCASWPREREDLTKRILERADAFVLFGDDATSAELTRLLRPGCIKRVYGSRVSFAVMDYARLPSLKSLPRYAERLAEDIVAYDQRGCLSPVMLYMIGGDAKLRADFLATLHSELLARARRDGFAPRIPDSAAAQIQSLRAIYSMDGSGRRRVLSNGGLPGWTLLYDEVDAGLRDSPGYQTLFISPLAKWDDLPAALAAHPGMQLRIQAVGVAPDPSVCPKNILTALKSSGLSRVCNFGEMQTPPLDWTHDGNPFFP